MLVPLSSVFFWQMGHRGNIHLMLVPLAYKVCLALGEPCFGSVCTWVGGGVLDYFCTRSVAVVVVVDLINVGFTEVVPITFRCLCTVYFIHVWLPLYSVRYIVCVHYCMYARQDVHHACFCFT